MKKIVIYLLASFFLIVAVSHADVLVITNKSVNEKSIPKTDIQNIFLGKLSKWGNNTKIRCAISKNEALHGAFLKAYVRRRPRQFIAHWKMMLFTGKGVPPKRFATTEELIEYVVVTKGAIGYIDSETIAENVNIISVK